MGRIFSPGKLLLTSEYTVLDGALALAVPTKPGQEFFYEEKPDGNSTVHWEAYHQDKLWLSAEIDYQRWQVLDANIPESAAFILNVLKNVQKFSTEKFQSNSDYYLKTNLQFPPDFGLGSSSTLMNNLAEWANIDPFVLNEESLGGSGYDVAVAMEKSALLYQLFSERKIETLTYNPAFKDKLIFIHLNQKQDSREGIRLYRSKEKSADLIHFFSNITKQVVGADSINHFSELMTVHEARLSEFLGLPTVKEKLFPDCHVFVKSLGAWGGDFVMSRKFSGFEDYFSEKGFTTILNWDSLID